MRAEALEAALGQPPLVSSALLRVDPRRVEALERALADLPRVAAVTRKAEVLAQFEAQSAEMIAVMTLIITLFGATITVGVVYNNARVALSLRSRDLASLRVLGYRRREVSAILLGEMAVQVLLAIPAGLWFGRVLIDGIASTVDPETYRLPIVLTDASYGYAVLVALAASALSALLVRRKLDRLDLIGALKTRE
jgi:putative ABC transport system permease protein